MTSENGKKVARIAMCTCGKHGRVVILTDTTIIHVDEQFGARRMGHERLMVLAQIYPDLDIEIAKVELNVQPIMPRRFNAMEKMHFHAVYNPSLVAEKFGELKRKTLHDVSNKQARELLMIGLNEVAEATETALTLRMGAEMMFGLTGMTIKDPVDEFLRRNQKCVMGPNAMEPKVRPTTAAPASKQPAPVVARRRPQPEAKPTETNPPTEPVATTQPTAQA